MNLCINHQPGVKVTASLEIYEDQMERLSLEEARDFNAKFYCFDGVVPISEKLYALAQVAAIVERRGAGAVRGD